MEPKRIDAVLAELKGLWPSMPAGNRRVVMAMEEAHEVITALAARLAEAERERDALADGLRRTEENRDNAMQDAQEEYDRAVAAEARLAEVERERDELRAGDDEATRLFLGAQKRMREAKTRAERLDAAVRAEIDARQAYENMPADRGGPHGPKGRAMARWLDARADVIAALQQEGGE
jgi:chromosome segregation ATPase